jgi:hypothetical protein
MLDTLGDKHPSFSAVKNWLARFKTGNVSTEGQCSERPTQVTFPENVDAIHSVILYDQIKSTK